MKYVNGGFKSAAEVINGGLKGKKLRLADTFIELKISDTGLLCVNTTYINKLFELSFEDFVSSFRSVMVEIDEKQELIDRINSGEEVWCKCYEENETFFTIDKVIEINSDINHVFETQRISFKNATEITGELLNELLKMEKCNE